MDMESVSDTCPPITEYFADTAKKGAVRKAPETSRASVHSLLNSSEPWMAAFTVTDQTL